MIKWSVAKSVGKICKVRVERRMDAVVALSFLNEDYINENDGTIHKQSMFSKIGGWVDSEGWLKELEFGEC